MAKKKKNRGNGRGALPRARYRKQLVAIWGWEWFRELDDTAKLLWMALTTAPETTAATGILRAGRHQMAEVLDWSLERFDAAWAALHNTGRVKSDWDARVIWMPGLLALDRPDGPNNVLSFRAHWDEIPDSDLRFQWLAEVVAYCTMRGPAWEAAYLRAFGDVREVELPAGFGEGSPEGSAPVAAPSRSGPADPSGTKDPDPDPDPDLEPEKEKEGGESRASAREPPPILQKDSEGELPEDRAARLGVPPRLDLTPDGLRVGRLFVEARARKGTSSVEPQLDGTAAVARRDALDRAGAFLRDLTSETIHLAVKRDLEAPDPGDVFQAVGLRAMVDWLGFGGSDGEILFTRGHRFELLVGQDMQDLRRFGVQAQQAFLGQLVEARRKLREEARRPARPTRETGGGDGCPPPVAVPLPGWVPPTHPVTVREASAHGAEFVLDLFRERFREVHGGDPSPPAEGDRKEAASLYELATALATGAQEPERLRMDLLLGAVEALFDGREHTLAQLRQHLEVLGGPGVAKVRAA
ncbi:MAG: hypothetical protein IT372_00080 [Polyangiaceae bacterium]|nr:hypothetical protein [Polyangiaceae bacterium]